MKCTNFLTNYLWLRKYIEIQEYRTYIEKNSCNDRMCHEVDLIAKCINQQTDQENAQYICYEDSKHTDNTDNHFLI